MAYHRVGRRVQPHPAVPWQGVVGDTAEEQTILSQAVPAIAADGRQTSGSQCASGVGAAYLAVGMVARPLGGPSAGADPDRASAARRERRGEGNVSHEIARRAPPPGVGPPPGTNGTSARRYAVPVLPKLRWSELGPAVKAQCRHLCLDLGAVCPL